MAKTVIKKYSNRRLYNTETSNYITFNELKEMIRNNQDFIVQDAKTGQDLTHSTLVQIIFEQESKGNSIFQIEFMKDIINMYDNNLFNIMPSFFGTTMKLFKENQAQLTNFYTSNNSNMDSFSQMGLFSNIAQNNLKLLQDAFTHFLNYGNKETDSKK